MNQETPINAPGGFAPAEAVGFASPSGSYVGVSAANPLPVRMGAAAAQPLSGKATASTLAGPFTAVSGRVVTVALQGDWQGSVALLRSTDGGTTRQPLKAGGHDWAVYTSSGCEQAWYESEDGVLFYLDVQLTSGNLTYRVSQ